MLHELLGLTRPFILLDLETTAKNPETARICSIGMRIWKPDGSVTSYKSLVNPQESIPATVSEKSHGITDDTIRYGCARCRAPEASHPHTECAIFKPVPRFRDLAESLHRGFVEADFGGYHVHWDLKVTAAEFKRCGIDFDYSSAALVDSLRLWQLLEPRTLSDAVVHFAGHELQGAHDAMIDILGTEEVLIGQLTCHPRSHTLPRSLRQLHELSWPDRIDVDGKFVFDDDGIPIFNFGKHKYEPMSEHVDYLKWMVKKGKFSSEVKRIAAHAINGQFPTIQENADDR